MSAAHSWGCMMIPKQRWRIHLPGIAVIEPVHTFQYQFINKCPPALAKGMLNVQYCLPKAKWNCQESLGVIQCHSSEK